MSGDDGAVHDALGEELERLTGTAAFTVAEFAGDTATICEVSRDENGTPAAVVWKYTYRDGLLQPPAERDRWSAAMTDPDDFCRQVAPKLIVRSAHPLADGLSDLLPDPREIPVYRCLASLRDLLRAAIRDSPLLLGYELAVLARVRDSRNGDDRLVLTGQQLFPPGETQPSKIPIRVDVEPTDGAETALAVVTREPRPDLARQERRLRPVQVYTAAIPPGTHFVTAVLTRPGQVRFEGLPVPLTRSSRSWYEFLRLIPGRLAAQAPVHLICLIEVCGGDELLRQRIERLEDLIGQAASGTGTLSVSVVAYGAHGVAWRVDDHPPQVRARTAPAQQAIIALRGLEGRQMDKREYPRAAQLECALKLVRENLAAADGRPVIVTAGGRPAHPPALDTSKQLIPCPEWVDGTLELRGLARQQGITFGALRDPGCRGGIWEQLGRDAVGTVDDAVDMEAFTAGLGLRAVTQTVPFPVI